MQSDPETVTVSRQRKLSEPVDPVLAEFLDAIAVERGRPGAQFTPRIFSEILNGDTTEINLGECHRTSIAGWLCFDVRVVHEDAHPLLPSPVCINCRSE